MKKILIYGDSNTWGQNGFSKRHSIDLHWASILSDLLGNEYKVIPSGLCARIAGDFEPKDYRNGKSHFEVIYRTESPVDILIVALGTNDLKDRFSRTAEQITNDILWYGMKAEELRYDNGPESTIEKVLYIAPPNLDEGVEDFSKAVRLQANVSDRLLGLTKNLVVASDLKMSEDGLHFSKQAHEEMGRIVFKKIKEGLR